MYNNQACLILLVISFSLAIGQKAGEIDQRLGILTNEKCAPKTITCICGTESNAVNHSVHVIVKTYVFKSPETHQKKCYPLSHPYETCKRISCELGPIEPETIGGPAIVSNSYPIEFSIPEGGDHHYARFARDAQMCHVKGLNHAHIKCWRWPDFVDCLINCSVGYALRSEEGSVLSKGISCTYDDNRWWPHGFQDCEPYINCNAHLVSAGTLKCRVPVDEPPYCEISCLDYEGKEGTKPNKYVCKDENFESTLPHCARLNKYEPVLEDPNKPKTEKTDYEIEEEK